MTKEQRVREMYEKFVELGGGAQVGETSAFDGTLLERKVKIEVTIPEALISLGIAKDEEEAELFLGSIIAGRLAVFVTEGMSLEGAMDVHYDFLKTGFHLGLLAGKVRERDGAN